jgi:NitT/TauT family transport system permease protein/taurine transport system permease protein
VTIQSLRFPATASVARSIPFIVAAAIRPFLPFLLFIALWQLSVRSLHLSSFLYPAPSSVLASFIDLLRKGILSGYTTVSLRTWFLSVAVSTAIVIPIGFVMSFAPVLNRGLMPVVRFFSSIPELAWLPLAVLWTGYSSSTVFLVIGYTVFFPVLYNIMLGLRQVPQVVIDATRTLGAGRFEVLRDVLFPGSLPGLVTGVRTGASYAFRALLVAELFSGTNVGIGYMIFSGLRSGNTIRTVVGMIVVGVLWLAIEQLFLRPVETATIVRWGITGRVG